MSDADWEPYIFSLAWVAFREESLLAKMRAAPHFYAAKRILIDASRYASGDTETGPCRADLRPYIYRVGGPGDAGHRLVREVRLGRVRLRYRVGDIIEEFPFPMWERTFIHFDSFDIRIVNERTGRATMESEWTWIECNFDDVRRHFDPEFTLLNFQGLWKPVVHIDLEDASPVIVPPVHSEDLEKRAIELLSQHLASLDERQRHTCTRAEAQELIARTIALSTRAFDRVWADARRRVGLPAQARAGRKPSQSPQPNQKSRR